MKISEVIECHGFRPLNRINEPLSGICSCSTSVLYASYQKWAEHLADEIKVESLASRLNNMNASDELLEYV